MCIDKNMLQKVQMTKKLASTNFGWDESYMPAVDKELDLNVVSLDWWTKLHPAWANLLEIVRFRKDLKKDLKLGWARLNWRLSELWFRQYNDYTSTTIGFIFWPQGVKNAMQLENSSFLIPDILGMNNGNLRRLLRLRCARWKRLLLGDSKCVTDISWETRPTDG